MDLLELEIQIKAILNRTDSEFKKFISKTAMSCPPGCGICCINHKVMTSALEVLPLAFQIYRNGEIERWADRTFDKDDGCQIFSANDEDRKSGRCSQYQLRPIICRSFGAMGVADKQGKLRLSLCHLIKEYHSEEVSHTETQMAKGTILVPRADIFQRQLNGLQTGWWTEIRPINQAIQEALKAVMQYMAYREHLK